MSINFIGYDRNASRIATNICKSDNKDVEEACVLRYVILSHGVIIIIILMCMGYGINREPGLNRMNLLGVFFIVSLFSSVSAYFTYSATMNKLDAARMYQNTTGKKLGLII